jgi:hypothetical protein
MKPERSRREKQSAGESDSKLRRALLSDKRLDGEARRRKIPFMGLRLRSNEARRAFGDNPSGGGSFARALRWLGRYSPRWGCASLAALPTVKISRCSTRRSFESDSLNAPHTADQIASDNWNRPYTREAAAFPAKSLHDYKFWPHVARVDNVFGDRNPVCSCVGMENYS